MKIAETFAELEGPVQRSLGKTGLMVYGIRPGQSTAQGRSRDTAKIMPILIDNLLGMKEMAKRIPTLDLMRR